MHLPKKVISCFILILLSAYSLKFITSTYAASPQDIFKPSLQQQIDEDTTIDKQAADNKQTIITNLYTEALQTRNKIYSFIELLACINPKKCNPKDTALGNTTQLITMLYMYPPASGVAYAYDLLNNAGLVKPAYAQGIGFAGLSPILPLWKMTRNIAYAAIILFMVAVGFMIIFRMKIDPKTVISVQAAIPRIVITLIIITLSYPIVGFLIDMMYLVMAILIGIIVSGMGQTSRIPEFQSYFMTADSGDLLKTVFSGGFSSVNDFLLKNVGNFGTWMGANTAVGLIAAFFDAGPWAWVIGGGGLAGILVLILFLGLLFTFIRLLLLLLNSYIQLLIAIILGPLQLLFEAIPGRSAFTEWLMNVLANLSVFPATVAILMFGEYLTTLNLDTPLLAPPLTWVPGKGTFTAFLGIGVIFLAPQLVAQIKKLFHPKPILPITAGTAIAPLTGGVQTAMGAASQFYYLQHTPFISRLFGHKPGS